MSGAGSAARADDVVRPGVLYPVATPIGNLGDMSRRAIEVLESVDVVACEDTRRLGRLTSNLGMVIREVVVVDDHREALVAQRLVNRLLSGESVALTTDAGTPSVSDPGFRLVAACVAAGVEVCAVPGPSAVMAALVASGLPTDRFVFEGFLPRRGAARAHRLAELETERRTAVLFESPKRVASTLEELAERIPDRPVAVCRELTKVYEETWRGDLSGAAARWAGATPRGEFVIVLGGCAEREVGDAEIRDRLERSRRGGATRRDSIDGVAADLGVPRNRVYRVALASDGVPESGA